MDTVARLANVASQGCYLLSLDASYAFHRNYFSAPLLPADLWLLIHDGIDYCWCVLPCCLNSSTMALTLAPCLERSPSLMVHFVGVYFTPNDASGSPPLGAASLGSLAKA